MKPMYLLSLLLTCIHATSATITTTTTTTSIITQPTTNATTDLIKRENYEIVCHTGTQMCWGAAIPQNVFGWVEDRYRKLDNKTVYKSGQHIICVKWLFGPAGFCLFWEQIDKDASGVERTGALVKKLLVHLLACEDKRCGVVRGGGNRLKIDYVGNTRGCHGIC